MNMAPAGIPLGSTTDFASFSTKSESAMRNPQDLKLKRWALQSVARAVLPAERVAWCYRRKIPGKENVAVFCSEKYKSAHYGGLAICGNIWICPICASKVTERRAEEMRRVVGTWKSKNKTVVLATYTLQHNRNESLSSLRTAQNESLRTLKSGRWWQEFSGRWKTKHTCKGNEITWGQANGWHPHVHELIFCDLPLDSFDEEEFKAELAGRYLGILDNAGYYASDLHGVDVQVGDDKVGEYLAKWGHMPLRAAWGVAEEITKGPVKSGRNGGMTPFQLLDLYDQGEKWAGALFVEFSKAMKGIPQLRWSNMIPEQKAELGRGEDKTDEQLAKEFREESYLLALLDPAQWRVILQTDKRGEVLKVASIGDPVKFWDYMASIGAKGSDQQQVASEYPMLNPVNQTENGKKGAITRGPGYVAKLTRLGDLRRGQVPGLRANDRDLTDFHRGGGDLRAWPLGEIQAARE